MPRRDTARKANKGLANNTALREEGDKQENATNPIHDERTLD